MGVVMTGIATPKKVNGIWRWWLWIIGKNWCWIRKLGMAWLRKLKPTKGC